MRTLVRLVVAVAAAATLAACGGVATPSSLTQEDFSGSVDPAGTANKQFSVAKTGEMQFTLQSLTPRPVVGFLSVAVGQPSGTDCLPFATYLYPQVALGQQYSFPSITKGSYCLMIYDANAILTASTSFAIHFAHP
jgi:hypothetical protein